MGIEQSGKVLRDGLNKAFVSGPWFKQGDTVQLDYDGPTSSLTWSCNGTAIHTEANVPPDYHFAVGSWEGTLRVQLPLQWPNS